MKAPVVKLWCTQCHTCWTEACWQKEQRCPFADCHGRLIDIAPPNLTKVFRRKQPKDRPLFEALK